MNAASELSIIFNGRLVRIKRKWRYKCKDMEKWS